MINLYTKEDYAKSYTELLEILKYVSYEDIQKIPKDKLSYYKENKDISHTYIYNPQLTFEKQDISKLTQILLANLYIDYWTTEEERMEIRSQDKKELHDIEMEKKKQYPTNDLFSKKKKTDKINTTITSLTVINKKSFFTKVITRIKKLLKLT